MKKYLFVEYPACGTCRKAKKWLEENGIEFQERHIVENRPTREELKTWLVRGALPLRKFFNTSGLVYKSMQLKDRLPGMSDEEQIGLLASDGKLVKRPLLIGEDVVLVGFDPEAWACLKSK